MDNFKFKDHLEIVVFTLDEPRYALDLSAVERIIRAVEITPLPKAPEVVLGVINMQGEVIPVMDIRKRFHLPEREMNIDDRFIIARTHRRSVALMVDEVSGVQRLGDQQVVSAEQALPFAGHIKGVAMIDNNLVLIYDLDQFLSLDDERKLDSALSKGTV